MTSLNAHLDTFFARLRARLDQGSREYGDASFSRPASELVDEIQQELEDVCGWGLLLWIRLARMHEQLTAPMGRGRMDTAKLRIESWSTASEDDARRGLLGYLTISFGPFLLDGITLRKTADGDTTLSFPARRDRRGRRHAYIRPIDRRALQEMEEVVLEHLRGRGQET